MENDIEKQKIDLGKLAKSNPEQTIRQHTDYLLGCLEKLYEIYGIERDIYCLVRITCEYHDYGKMNEQFQYRIHHGTRFDDTKEVPHNILSAFFVNQEMLGEDYLFVLYAVMNHHRGSASRLLKEKSELIQYLLEPYDHFSVSTNIFGRLIKIRNDKKTILIKGLLHRCDYAASAGIEVEFPHDFLEEAMKNLLAQWKKRDNRSDWRDLQKFCLAHKENNLIITAPTGMGKTEAALLWIGNEKGFYILPLITAINGIFDRIAKDILQYRNIDERLALLHSDTVGYLEDKPEYKEMDLYDYRTSAKQLALPITISTLDQIFDFVLKTFGYETKLATLAYAKIVIDEIQAYDGTLLAYLIYGIHEILRMGGHVAILTATLPGFVRDYLVEQINADASPFVEKDFSENMYNKMVRHHLTVLPRELSVEDVLDQYQQNKAKHKFNKILVICNTVQKAQDMYDCVRAQLPDTEVYLLHAKFIKMDRSRLEDAIRADGKTETIKDVIWITTQVVEASLDIDFDVLFTELSDLNGLFQRMGRCNRKGMKSTDKPNCFVYTEIDDNLLRKSKGKQGFIDETMYLLSKEALQEVKGVITEAQKTELIHNYFSTERIQESNFRKTYRETYAYLQELDVNTLDYKDCEQRLRNILSVPVIPDCVYQENEELLEQCQQVMHQSLKKGHSKDEEKNLWIKKQEARDTMMKYTVSIGLFEARKHSTLKKIAISSTQDIAVVDCVYSKEKGFVRQEKEYDRFL